MAPVNWQPRKTINGVGDIYSSTLSVIRVDRGACKASQWPGSSRKIGAARNRVAVDVDFERRPSENAIFLCRHETPSKSEAMNVEAEKRLA